MVGGVAANVHGAVRATDDLDLVYRRTHANMSRLADALSAIQPYLDLPGEIAGGGGYGKLLPHSEAVDMPGMPCQVLDLTTLIASRKAAGRPKDLDAVAELNAIRGRS